MQTGLKDKVVLVTGGSSGIGKATVAAFANEGAKICFSYKTNQEGAQSVITELEQAGTKIKAFKADLTHDAEAKRLIDFTISEFGHIDIAVNNAGRYMEGDDWNGEADLWMKSLQQNLISTMSVSKYAITHMQSRKIGVIVNTASRHGLSGQYDALTYAASKASIINLTQAYAKLMAPWGRANSVSPGAVRAGYWATAPQEELEENINGTLLESIVEPDDIANAVIFLSSNQSKMVTGHNLIVDAGYLAKK